MIYLKSRIELQTPNPACSIRKYHGSSGVKTDGFLLFYASPCDGADTLIFNGGY